MTDLSQYTNEQVEARYNDIRFGLLEASGSGNATVPYWLSRCCAAKTVDQRRDVVDSFEAQMGEIVKGAVQIMDILSDIFSGVGKAIVRAFGDIAQE